MKQRITLLLLAAVLLLLTACSSLKMPKPEDARVVLTLSGEEIYYDYFRYVYLNTKADLDGGKDSYWEDAEAEEELKEKTLEVLLRNRAIQLLAEEYDVALSKKDKQEILASFEEMKEQSINGEAFLDGMKRSFMTDYSFIYVQCFTALWREIYEHITAEDGDIVLADDETLLADIPKNFRRIRYIMIERNATDEEGQAEERAEAEQALRLAQEGGDFIELIEEYGDDTTMAGLLTEGYYYTLTSIVAEVETAVESLSEGEISGVIELPNAYYIVQRLSIDNAYVEKNLEDFRVQYKARIFNEMVAALQEGLTVEYSELWEAASTKTVS